jgi:hypothetical protein
MNIAAADGYLSPRLRRMVSRMGEPVHAGETIGPGLMSKILRESELSRDELIELRG